MLLSNHEHIQASAESLSVPEVGDRDDDQQVESCSGQSDEGLQDVSEQDI